MAEHNWNDASAEEIQHERWQLLEAIDEWTERPLIFLSLVWLGLLILDFTRGLSPLLQNVSYAIWALFILDFLIEIAIAPHKLTYLRRNWLTAIALMLPALRILRVFRALQILRAVRAIRSISLLRVITSLNRSMRAVSRTLSQRGVGYVVILTILAMFGGAAGVYAFENPVALRETDATGPGLADYGEAIWWTAMIMTTVGSEYWPQTTEGRLLGWLLSVYGMAVFGYITANIASYFVGQNVRSGQVSRAADEALRAELAALRDQLARLNAPEQAPATHRAAAPEPPHHQA